MPEADFMNGKPVQVLFDATRLLARAAHTTPTGIDRVDLAYIEAVRADARFKLHLLAFDPFGPKLLETRMADRLIDAVALRWQSTASRSQATHSALQHWLRSPPGTERPRFFAAAETEARSSGERLQNIGRAGLDRPLGGLRLRKLLSDNGADRVYVNTSHGRLFRRAVSRWLSTTGTGAVFFVHDLIPIEYPEFNRPNEPARHAARLETVAAHARNVIVNSHATRDALLRYLQQRHAPAPPVTVLPLGITSRFEQRESEKVMASSAPPYFVMLSTIEPRKNHQLMLQIWRRLIETQGDDAPRLVLIGRRGWENQTVFNLIDRSPQLAKHIVECSGLSDNEIASVLRGARALLAPSFAEGYGLPVAEALALGTPVIASDISAHREVGGEWAEYLDPLDGTGWWQAIQDYSLVESGRREHRLSGLHSYRPPTWRHHFSSALDLIGDAARKTC